jgi:DNA-binding response OmpR family regulator
MMLKLNDFDVYPYTEPGAALAAFRKGQFDLLLLDVRMPVMTGFELYRKIKEIDENVRVCFMTNYLREYVEEFRKSFPELGDKNFAAKPAAVLDLLKIVQGHLRHQ